MRSIISSRVRGAESSFACKWLKECKNVYEMLPDMKKPNQFAYYALFDNKDGEKTAVIFEVSPSILKAFVYYNSANTVTKEFQ